MLGVDLGARRIGVAISDASRTLASPYSVLDAGRGWEDLARIADDEEADLVVVGIPVSMDGRERDAARNARERAGEIESALGLPVETWDERLTSVEAHRRLAETGVHSSRRRAKVDAFAAALMLQGWLDAHRGAA